MPKPSRQVVAAWESAALGLVETGFAFVPARIAWSVAQGTRKNVAVLAVDAEAAAFAGSATHDWVGE